jgi:ABC-type bacteriocin/lantibiotic exporter with double-glycine peptidase domain
MLGLNLRKKRVLAGLALAALFCLAVGFLAVVHILSSPDGWRRVLAWQSGGEFLGTDGVVLQDNRNNCGPAALKMVFDHYGISSSTMEIEESVGITDKGSSMLALREMALLKGLRAVGWRYTLEAFLKAPMPAILFVNHDHFVVVDSVSDIGDVYLRDPAVGRIKLSQRRLTSLWRGETLVFGRK